MHVSVNSMAFLRGNYAHVYLFGLQAKKVHAADDVEGYIDIYKCDENGNIYFDENGEFAICRIYGEVRIEPFRLSLS